MLTYLEFRWILFSWNRKLHNTINTIFIHELARNILQKKMVAWLRSTGQVMLSNQHTEMLEPSVWMTSGTIHSEV